jgi:arabinofuranosyltransferase
MLNKKSTRIFLFIVCAVSFILITVKVGYFSDDAFISFRYAKNFVNGFGLVYNIGEKVEGYTNFLWVLISSGLISLNIEPLLGTRIISIISALFIFFLTYLISVRIFHIDGFYNFIAIILLELNIGFIAWTFSGMETTFFTLVVTSGVYLFLLYLEKLNIKYYTLSSLIFIIGILIRPDGILFFSFSLIFIIWYLIRSKTLKKNVFYALIIPGILFLIIIIPYYIWRYKYYGFIFPNSYYAKTGGNYYQYIRGMFYTLRFVKEALISGFLLTFIVYLFYKKISSIKYQYLIMIVTIYLIFIVAVGGDGLGVQRFFVPIMPIIFIFIQNGIYLLTKDYKFSKIIRYSVIFLIFFSSFSILLDNKYPISAINSDKSNFSKCILVGKWLKQNALPNESIAVYPAGIIPYISDLYTIDRYGLNDIYIAHKEIEGMGTFTAGHEKADDEYVFRKKPTYVIDYMPTYEKDYQPDLFVDSLIYRFNSVYIGTGNFLIDNSKFRQTDLYFNFYKLENSNSD